MLQNFTRNATGTTVAQKKKQKKIKGREWRKDQTDIQDQNWGSSETLDCLKILVAEKFPLKT